MSTQDQVLIDRWVERHDAEAFKSIPGRYAGMVYGTCRRMLNNAPEVEDVAQECFEDLVRAGTRPGAFLGPWLHRVATNKCLKRIRTEDRRKRREQAYARSRAEDANAATWDDVFPYVDEAIANLPERYRLPIVAHFFEDQTHEAIARTLGMSRQTVTYRINKGVERIRRSLRGSGVAITALGLAPLLKAHVAEAAPAALVTNLGRMALAGPSAVSAVAGATKTGAFLGALLGAKQLAGIAAILLLGLAGIWSLHTGFVRADSPSAAVAKDEAPGNRAISKVADAPTRVDEPKVFRDAAPSNAAGGGDAKPPLAAKVAAAKQEAALTRKDVEAALASDVSIEFENIHVQEILEFVADSWKLNVALDQRVVTPRRRRAEMPSKATDTASPLPPKQYVTDGIVANLDVRETPIREILHQMCRPLGLDFVVYPGYVWVSSPELIAAEAGEQKDSPELRLPVEQILEREVNLEFNDVHISEILGFVADSYDVNVVWDYRAIQPPIKKSLPTPAPPSDCLPGPNTPLQSDDLDLCLPSDAITDGMVPFIQVKNIPLRETLHALLRPLNLSYRVEDGFLWVSSPDKIKNEPFQAVGLSHASPALTRALTVLVSFDFENVRIAALLEDEQKSNPITFLVNKRAVHGDEPMLRSLKVKRLPTHMALAIALQVCGLTALAEGDTLFVSTPSGLALRNDKDGAFVPVQELLEASRKAAAKAEQAGQSPETATGTPASSQAPGSSASPALLSIRVVDGKPHAQIQTVAGAKWYDIRDQFEQYKVEEILPELGRCTLRDTSGNLAELSLAGPK